jgi:hypothetical protein
MLLPSQQSARTVLNPPTNLRNFKFLVLVYGWSGLSRVWRNCELSRLITSRWCAGVETIAFSTRKECPTLPNKLHDVSKSSVGDISRSILRSFIDTAQTRERRHCGPVCRLPGNLAFPMLKDRKPALQGEAGFFQPIDLGRTLRGGNSLSLRLSAPKCGFPSWRSSGTRHSRERIANQTRPRASALRQTEAIVHSEGADSISGKYFRACLAKNFRKFIVGNWQEVFVRTCNYSWPIRWAFENVLQVEPFP